MSRYYSTSKSSILRLEQASDDPLSAPQLQAMAAGLDLAPGGDQDGDTGGVDERDARQVDHDGRPAFSTMAARGWSAAAISTSPTGMTRCQPSPLSVVIWSPVRYAAPAVRRRGVRSDPPLTCGAATQGASKSRPELGVVVQSPPIEGQYSAVADTEVCGHGEELADPFPKRPIHTLVSHAASSDKSLRQSHLGEQD